MSLNNQIIFRIYLSSLLKRFAHFPLHADNVLVYFDAFKDNDFFINT